jgi:transglutaminase-like putative cysteine protease
MRMTIVVGLLLPAVAVCAPPPAHADVWKDRARYRVEYRTDLSQLSVRPRQRVRVWVPYPATTPDQTVVSGEIEAPWPYRLTRDAVGNQMVYLEGSGPAAGPLVVRAVVERSPSHGIAKSAIVAGTPEDPERYHTPAQLVPLDGVIRQIADQESTGLSSDDAKARAFYDYVVRTMSYDKSGEGWGRGDAVWACTNKRGNCTDFHSLFIGMAMSQGIAARFTIGFPIPVSGDAGEIPGYHCWAEFYSPTQGWVPIDASEAKKSGKTEAYFGALPDDRIQFSLGRDLHLEPAQDGPPLNYFVYPYVEIDGAPVTDLKPAVHFERLAAAGA